MSQAQMTIGVDQSGQQRVTQDVIEAEAGIQEVLDVLDDPDCRAILDETGEVAHTATEISDSCDLPLSTTYRKLDQLVDVGLIAEGTRIRRSGKHASEYLRAFEDVVLSVGSSGTIELTISRHASGTETRR